MFCSRPNIIQSYSRFIMFFSWFPMIFTNCPFKLIDKKHAKHSLICAEELQRYLSENIQKCFKETSWVSLGTYSELKSLKRNHIELIWKATYYLPVAYIVIIFTMSCFDKTFILPSLQSLHFYGKIFLIFYTIVIFCFYKII